jgi:hypothetical protein
MQAFPNEDISQPETNHAAQESPVTFDKCNCPVKFVSLKTFKATFIGLDHEEEYFPMISRCEPQAFFGLAPAPVRPTALVRAPPTSPIHIRRSSPVERVLPAYQQYVRNTLNGGHEDLYDASSNVGNEFMDVNTPHLSPSTQTIVTESESSPDRRGGNVESRTASPPQVRRPVTIRVLVRNNSKHLAFMVMIYLIPRPRITTNSNKPRKSSQIYMKG